MQRCGFCLAQLPETASTQFESQALHPECRAFLMAYKKHKTQAINFKVLASLKADTALKINEKSEGQA